MQKHFEVMSNIFETPQVQEIQKLHWSMQIGFHQCPYRIS